MSDTLTIQIPYDLARYAVWQRSIVNKYETNTIVKALDTWLILKAETASSLLQSWNKQKNYLLALCKCTESIFRHRLKILRDLELLTFDRYNIRVGSWDQLAVKFEIDIKKRFPLQYNINDKQRVQDWIFAIEIQDNKNRQAYKVMQKLGKNPIYHEAVIKAMLKAGAERSKIKNSEYFLSWLKILYRSDFVWESEIHPVMIEIRPDTNRGVRGIAEAWRCKRPQSVSYRKKVMKDAKIIEIDKLQIQSQERVRNQSCTVLWLKKEKQTLLCLCDNITLLTPWTASELLKNLPAA